MAKIEELSRRELQALAKSHGIKANGSNKELALSLGAFFLEQANAMPKTPEPGDLGNASGKDQDGTTDHHEALSASLAALKLRSRGHGHASAPDADSQPLSTHTSGAKPTKVVLPPIALDIGGRHAAKTTATTSRGRSLTARAAPSTVSVSPMPHTARAQSAVTSATGITPQSKQPAPIEPLLGMEDLMQSLRQRLAPGHSAGTSGLYQGLVLSGPRGCGKTLLARTLATETGARLVVLDVQAAVAMSDAAQAGQQVVQAFRACLDCLQQDHTGSVVLLLRGMQALARMHDDPAVRTVTCRVKAELIMGLSKVKSAAMSKMPTASPSKVATGSSRSKVSVTPPSTQQGEAPVCRALVLATWSCEEGSERAGGQGGSQGVDTVLMNSISGSAGGSGDLLVHVTLPDLTAREAILYHYMCKAEAELHAEDMESLSRVTEGLSGAELVQLCKAVQAFAADVRDDRKHMGVVHPQDWAEALASRGIPWSYAH